MMLNMNIFKCLELLFWAFVFLLLAYAQWDCINPLQIPGVYYGFSTTYCNDDMDERCDYKCSSSTKKLGNRFPYLSFIYFFHKMDTSCIVGEK